MMEQVIGAVWQAATQVFFTCTMNNIGLVLDTLNLNPNLDLLSSESQNTSDDLYFDFNPLESRNLDCKFYDTDSLKLNFSDVSNVMKFLSVNIRSLSCNFSRLKEWIYDLENNSVFFDIIALQEVWQIPYPDLFSLEGFQPLVFNCRSRGRGGGVGFFVRQGLKFKVLNELSIFSEGVFESMCIQIDFSERKSVHFVSLYRPPASDQFTNFLDIFNNLTSALDAIECYILTDSNLDLLKLESSKLVHDYFYAAVANGFLNLITKATRISDRNFLLIDQILTNSESKEFKSGVIIDRISDHFMTFGSVSSTRCIKKTQTVKSRNFSVSNKVKFKSALNNLSWNSVLDKNDVNLAFSVFWSFFSTLYDLHFPVISAKFNKNKHKIQGFMSEGLLVSRTTKLELSRLAIAFPTIENKQRFLNYRNFYNKIIRAAKKTYFEKNLENSKNDPKSTWSLLNEALNRKSKKNSHIDSINLYNSSITDSEKIADEFNRFFTNIGQEIAENIPNTCVQPEEYLQEPTCESFSFDRLNSIMVEELINSLDSKPCKDIYEISTSLIRFVSKEISCPLAHIFNLSLDQGTFPDALKISRTVPVFKSGDPSDMNNYRPISCLPAMSKILEKFVSLKLRSYLTSNVLLNKFQFGFQAKTSTVHPIMHIIDFITQGFKNNEYSVAVYLDFKKAFDVVNHDILLKKLNKLGINGVCLKWFCSYLKNRRQTVQVNGKFSTFYSDISMSVLQGSLLGPLLFLCFINDMPLSNALFNILFADDTTCLTRGKNLSELVDFVNTELQKLGVWIRANKLAINASKTKIMIFHKNKTIPQVNFVFNNNDPDMLQDPSLIYPVEIINNNSPTPAFKMLGIYLDENLSFNYHVKQLSSKISKSLYLMRSARYVLTSKGLKSVYYALIHSHLIYCLPAYSCTSKSNINSIFLKQKQAIRLICHAKYNAHTAPLFYSQGILPFTELINLHQLSFIHSFHLKLLPNSFLNFFLPNSARELNYEFRNVTNYLVPMVRAEFLKKYPLYLFPVLWNSLPNELKNLTSLRQFKSNIYNSSMSTLLNFRCERLFCPSCIHVKFHL